MLRNAISANLRGLRKSPEHKIQSHHEAHEGHEDRKKFLLIFFSSLRDLRAFVVNISSSYTLRLGVFAGDTPDSLVASDTSGRTKKAHAFARVEDVALCPS